MYRAQFLGSLARFCKACIAKRILFSKPHTFWKANEQKIQFTSWRRYPSVLLRSWLNHSPLTAYFLQLAT